MRKLVKWWSGFHRVEKILKSKPELSALEFILAGNKEYNVQYTINNLSEQKVFHSTIFFCNHPTGALDFLSVYPYLSTVAPDLKVVLNKKLLQLAPLREISFPVNPVSSGVRNDETKSELAKHLERKGNVLIYPAGKVGSNINGDITDAPWRLGLAEILKSSEVNVVPIFVKARNSDFFYFIRKFFPKISLLLLLKELEKSSHAEVTIGTSLNIQNKKSMGATELLNHIRSEVYALHKSGVPHDYQKSGTA